MAKATTNYKPKSASDITLVPTLTDFFTSWPSGWKGALTRQWLLFFQSLQTWARPQTFWRTAGLVDLTAGADIAQWVPAQAPGTALRVDLVLRKPITSNLVVTIKQNGTPLITCTVDAQVVPGKVLTYTQFLTSGAIAQGDVFSWAISSSDGTTDPNGVATLTLLWR